MKALVTGGAGFIGTHLLQYLATHGIEARGFDIQTPNRVFGIDISPSILIQGDIQNQEQLAAATDGCDTIFHLASLLGTDFLITRAAAAVQTNILGTINVLEVARRLGVKVVFLSLLPDWPNPYMITKNAAAKFCDMYYHEFGTSVVVIRGCHIYGERQRWEPVVKAVPNFIRAALLGQPLRVYGTGHQLMDLLHIQDAARALVLAADSSKAIGKSFELGSGVGIQVRELAALIVSLCHSSSSIDFAGPRPGEPESDGSFTPAHTTDQKSLLNFEPEISLTDGLMRTIAWYRSHI